MHTHDAPHGAEAGDSGRLWIVLALVLGLLALEVSVAVATGSLALLSDAGHLATDVAGLGLALAAITIASARAPTTRTSFGWHRLEILAALGNALLLLAVAIAVVASTALRWNDPHPIEPGPLLLVATAALGINVVCAWLLRPGAQVNLNIQGARLEVLADAAGSVGVLIAAGVIYVTGWTRVDSIMALLIVAWILPRSLRLGGRALRVLLQHAPAHLDLAALESELAALPTVLGIHDLHVWTLTSGMDVASLHVEVAAASDQHDALHLVTCLVTDRTGIDHVTVQLDLHDDSGCCADRPPRW